MLSSYIGIKKGLYKRYMDDVDGAASCGEQDLRQFLEFASSFHPHLEYTISSSKPYSCKSSIPYSQFLRLHKICSDDVDFDIEAAKMETFFAIHSYPIGRRRELASTKSRA